MREIIGLTSQTSIAIVINGFILVLLLRSKSLRKVKSNIFLINLIVADLVTAFTGFVACMTHYTRTATGVQDWEEKKAVSLFMFIFTSTLIATLIAVILVTLDRFVAVVKPFRYQELFTRRNITIMLAVVWFLGALVLVAGLTCATIDDPEVIRIAQTTLDILLIVISSTGIAFLIVANAIILREVRKQIKLVSSVSVFGTDTEAAKRSEMVLRRKETRAVYLCLSIVVLFTICWLPFTVGLALVRHETPSGEVFMNVGKTLVFIGIALNPCLYVPFKSELSHTICKCFCKKTSSSEAATRSDKRSLDQTNTNDVNTLNATESII